MIFRFSMAALAIFVSSAAAQVSSTFDVDLDGWVVVGDNEASWCCGSLDIDDLVTGTANVASAPPKFLGDWSSALATDTLSWSLYFSNTSGGTLVTPPHMVRLAGPGGDARGIVPGIVPGEDAWQTFEISLDPSEWALVSGTWTELLDQVNIVELYAEFVSGDEDVRVDDVALSFTPDTVLSECAVSTFNDGQLDSWSVSGSGGTSNPNDDGNSLGYLRVAEGPGNAYAFAPAFFLGDWSSFEGDGSFTVDVRVIGRSGANLGSPDFVTLSGPGGSAHVSLEADDLPVGDRHWVTYEFPLTSDAWTVDSGTWSGLLTDVTSCRIDAEYFTSTETIGLDNIGRRMASCPEIDAPVVVHVPDVSLTRTIGFVDAYSAARNPVDDLFYAIVREQASNGGGFYPATGPQAGVRTSALLLPAQLLIDDDGDAFVSLDNAASIQRVPLGGVAETWANGFHSGDDDLWGMAFAPSGFDGPNVDPGDIVVTDVGFNGPDEIWAFSPDTPEGERQITPDPGPDTQWFGVTDGPGGTMWIADATVSNTLFQLLPDGTLVPQAIPLASPRALRYAAGENAFYVFDVVTGAIHRLDASSWTSELVIDGFRGIGSAALSISSLSTLVVVDVTGDRIYEFALPSTVSTPEAPPAAHPLFVGPNPFAGATEIGFDLALAGTVAVSVFDVSGRRVATLANQHLSAGAHRVRWDGRGARGPVAPGVYFVQVRSGGVTSSARVLVAR